MTETGNQEELTILRQIIERLAGKGRLLTVEARKVLEKQREETLKELLEKIDKLLEKEDVFVRKDEIEQLLGEKERETLVIPSAKVFRAEAKGIKSRMRILRNPGAKVKDKDVTYFIFFSLVEYSETNFEIVPGSPKADIPETSMMKFMVVTEIP